MARLGRRSNLKDPVSLETVSSLSSAAAYLGLQQVHTPEILVWAPQYDYIYMTSWLGGLWSWARQSVVEVEVDCPATTPPASSKRTNNLSLYAGQRNRVGCRGLTVSVIRNLA
jgi:hypothetical protein